MTRHGGEQTGERKRTSVVARKSMQVCYRRDSSGKLHKSSKPLSYQSNALLAETPNASTLVSVCEKILSHCELGRYVKKA